ncbi:MAG: helix-turn-helix domain-containing protein [Chthoniobacterales bacterium]
MKNSTQPIVLKIKEAADYLAVGTNTIRRLIARGLLRRLPFSRHILILKSDLDQFIDDQLT